MVDIFHPDAPLDQRTEQARQAVKVFRSMQPQLTSYARAVSKRKDVRVELSSGGASQAMTDNTRIFYTPPISLGDMKKHDRALCDKRGKDLKLRCPACKVREEVLVSIYHELGHICFDTFMPVSDTDKVEITRRAIEEGGSRFAQRVMDQYKMAPGYVRNSYKGLSALISEFLPLIFNGLEDARVNREMFTARKGLRLMFEAQTREIFERGVQQKNAQGETVHIFWKDYPLNLQIIVGCFCKLSEYEFEGWFHPKVEEDLRDPGLVKVLNGMNAVRDPGGVYNLSFRVLEELRRLGYCKSKNDPEEEPPDEEEAPEQGDGNSSDESGDASGSTEQPSGGLDESEDESDSEDGGGEDSGDGESSSNSGTDGEPSDSDSDDGDEQDSDPSGTGSMESRAGSEDPQDDESESGDGEGTGSDPSSSQAGSSSSSDESGGTGQDSDSEDGSSGETEPSVPTDPEGDAGEGADSEDSSSGSSMGSVPSETSSEGRPSDESESSAGDNQGSQELNDGQDTPGHQDEHLPDGAEQVDGDGELLASGGESEPNSEASEAPVESPEGRDPRGDGLDYDSPSSDDDGSEGDESYTDPEWEAEAVDTGADEGKGGWEVEEELDYGTADEIAPHLREWVGHPDLEPAIKAQLAADKTAVEIAIVQGVYFETPSQTIGGVVEVYYDKPAPPGKRELIWGGSWHEDPSSRKMAGIDADIDTPESVLGPALMRMRVAFADNKRAHDISNLKSGKVNSRVLGKRVFHDDPRLFKKRTIPGKKDYFVTISMDVSGSTTGVNLVLMKRAVMAQATLLSRMGVPFAIYAHTCSTSIYGGAADLDVFLVKEVQEPWNVKVQERLREIGPGSGNVDGHALEYMRKVADRSNATHKIILYYSDGKMPAYNHDEELMILQREIRTCRKLGYTLLGVGIRTDSPARHGLDTVQVDDDADIVRVVRHIERRLLSV